MNNIDLKEFGNNPVMSGMISEYLFKQELITKYHYPEDAVILEYQYIKNESSSRVFLDIAVINPTTKEILIGFELKRNTHAFKRNAEKFFERFSNSEFPIYLVTFDDTHIDNVVFKLYDIKYDENNKIKIKQIPEAVLQSLLSSQNFQIFRDMKEIEESKDTRKRNLDIFTYLCVGISLFVLILFLCTIFNCFIITWEKFALLILSITLIVFPFIERIKIFDVEIERFNPFTKKNADDNCDKL